MNHNIFFFDFETTGLNPFHNDIIEVAIKKDGVDEFYETLIKPDIDIKEKLYIVSSRVVEITGITDRMLLKKGISTQEAITSMLDYIERQVEGRGPIYLVAHNGSSFDFLFFKRYLKQFDLTNRIINRFRYIDTVHLAKLFMGDERVNQPKLCKQYGIVNEQEHRSLGDVTSLEQIYKYLCMGYTVYMGKEDDYYYHHPEEIVENTFA